jgi:hypothetical protein
LPFRNSHANANGNTYAEGYSNTKTSRNSRASPERGTPHLSGGISERYQRMI